MSPPKEKGLTMFFSKKCFFYSFTQTNMKAKGFTLIELLVVITIIGILATGATALYTGAQQKARDSVRITDIQVVKSAVEQAYGDDNEYLDPDDAVTTGTIGTLISRNYLTAGPVDVKEDEEYNGTALAYTYSSADTTNGGTAGEQQLFEVSTGFESPGNITGKAEGQGDDDDRFEIGNDVDNVDTSRAEDETMGTNTVGGTENTDAIVLPES
jgi:prepilin-type N-terminal cleavage/methylation domain-containing protein